MDNNEREAAAGNPELEEQYKLEGQLREVAVAEEFFNQSTGKLWLEVATKQIANIVNEITSERYINDHNGYLEKLGELRAIRKQVRSMQVAASPVRKAKLRERLDEQENV